jgi:hypothetical protein
MVKLMVLLVRLNFLDFFGIWFQWMLRRWITLLVSFLYQPMSGFVQADVFSTFECDAICFIVFFNKNFDQWIHWVLDIYSAVNFWAFKTEVYVEVDAIVVSIQVLKRIGWTGPLRRCEDVFCNLILPPRFPYRSGLLETGFDCIFEAVGWTVLSGWCYTGLPEGRLHLSFGLWRATPVVLQDECLTPYLSPRRISCLLPN